MHSLIPDSWLICTVFGLENSSCPWYINIITIFRVSPYYKFLGTVRTFHTEFIYFSAVEITNPCFYWIKSDTLGNHVLTTLASDMEGCLISNFATSHPFSFYNFEWLILCKLTLFGWNFGRVVVFWVVKVVGSGSSKSTHWNYIYNYYKMSRI